MILVTGGLGFIGSHTCVALDHAGFAVTIVDNLSNSKLGALERIRSLGSRNILFHQADIRDRSALHAVFSKAPVKAVVHFAGLKAVGESLDQPLRYHDNNIGGALALLDVMARNAVQHIVFSSSSTVYGIPQHLPVTEKHPIGAISPYGRTKQAIEGFLEDIAIAQPGFRFSALRYFNPIGAHPSGRMGEDPLGVPSNVFPFMTQVAVGRRNRLRIFGNDYDTIDGTPVRDYLHVMDVADGHVAALRFLLDRDSSISVNLGTGRGLSVLELVNAFEKTIGFPIAREFAPRRPGDVASCYADASMALRELGWKANLGVEDMCRDAWAWQSTHPQGYPD